MRKPWNLFRFTANVRGILSEAHQECQDSISLRKNGAQRTLIAPTLPVDSYAAGVCSIYNINGGGGGCRRQMNWKH